MIKHIALSKAIEGLEIGSLIDQYENEHAPLMERLLPGVGTYRRNYLLPGAMLSRDPLGASDQRPDFDVVTEIQATIAGQAMADLLMQTQARLFDPARTRVIPCQEFVTPGAHLQPRPSGHSARPAVKLMGMIRRRTGMSRDAFIDRYEQCHCSLALDLLTRNGLPIFAEYSRSYPLDGEQVDRAPGSARSPAPPFDVLTQVAFWTEADFLHFQAQCSDPMVDAAIAEDEAKLFDRSSIVMFSVEEHI